LTLVSLAIMMAVFPQNIRGAAIAVWVEGPEWERRQSWYGFH
jgi:hypothetical protein